MSQPKLTTGTPETAREMVARWLRESPDKPRFTLTRQMLEELTRESGIVCDACGWPTNPDGSCTRTQCCNAD